MNDVRCVAVLGPTCCWKSEVGLRLAEACGGEIVSCDSMQIYRGLPIGTAQPDAAELAASVFARFSADKICAKLFTVDGGPTESAIMYAVNLIAQRTSARNAVDMITKIVEAF